MQSIQVQTQSPKFYVQPMSQDAVVHTAQSNAALGSIRPNRISQPLTVNDSVTQVWVVPSGHCDVVSMLTAAADVAPHRARRLDTCSWRVTEWLFSSSYTLTWKSIGRPGDNSSESEHFSCTLPCSHFPWLPKLLERNLNIGVARIFAARTHSQA